MKRILDSVRWFFSGLGLFLPLVPGFIWIAITEVYDSTVKFWKNSQVTVDNISYKYLEKAPERLTSEYDRLAGNVFYCLASFLYLLVWLAMSWLTMEALRLLISWIF